MTALGPDRQVRLNLYPSADINGSTLPGLSAGEELETMEELAAANLPPGFGFAWTELAYREWQAWNGIVFLYPPAVLFLLLTLAVQYESWLVPLAMVGCFAHFERLQHRRDVLTCGQRRVTVTELLHDLLRRVPLASLRNGIVRHRVSPGRNGRSDSHNNWIERRGAGQENEKAR